jgi:hypothetical protein
MKKISEVDEKPFTSSLNFTGEKPSRRLSISVQKPAIKNLLPLPAPNFPTAPWKYL